MSSKRTGKSPSGRSVASSSGATCAECRRLKIRCDRKVPCEQCKRRGCASICPEGQLVPAHGHNSNRVMGQVPANIDSIYRKLETYTQRIQELESALESTHSQVSQSAHPLLAADLVRLTQEEEMTAEDESSPEGGAGGDGKDDEMIALAFGSLVKSGKGSTRYLGPSAASAWLFQSSQDAPSTHEELPALASTLSFIWPSAVTRLRSQIETHLPSNSVLRSMVNSYFKYSLSLFQPLTPSSFTEDCIIQPVNSLSTPQLSLLFIVLALAAQLDPSPSPNWLSPSFYYTLSRAALTLEDIHANTSIETVESIGLQGLFLLRHDGTAVPERAWAMIGLAMRCAQAMGLHRDSRRWGIAEETVQRRRRTFYELWTFDILLSACLGRSPSLTRYQVDCEMPMDDSASLGQNPAFYRWKHQLISTTMLEIATTALSSPRPPAYSTIISLDKQFRASPLPERLPAAADPCRPIDRNSYPEPTTRWQEHTVRLFNTYTLILLHRPFFARALLEAPKDLFKHRFLRSVMTLHDSSQAIIRHVVWMATNEPETLKMISLWHLAMTCSLVSLGALLIKAPTCTLAVSCIRDLDVGCQYLFGSETTSHTQITMLLKLYSAAHNAMTSAHGSQYAASSPIIQLAQKKLDRSRSSQSPEPVHRSQPQPQPTLIVPSEFMVPSEGLQTPAPTSPTPSITVMSPPPETPQVSGHPSPFMVSPMLERRSSEHDASVYNFSDYVRMHTFQAHGSSQSPTANLPPPVFNNGLPSYSSSHLSPYPSDVESAYASPFPGGSPVAHHSSGGGMQLSHQEIESISWEQFMSSIGL